MLNYIFHYNVPTTVQPLNCESIEAGCEKQALLQSKNDIDLCEEEVDTVDGLGITFDTNPARHLNNTKLWADVARLQWRITSDGIITFQAANNTIAELRVDGTLCNIRLAVCWLITALSAKYPALGRVGRPAITQLIALGRDMVISTGESPELLEFIEKELQAVDLSALLCI